MMNDAFLREAEPFQAAIRVHCYRMLGSSSDVDDVMQEVLVRAWRARESLSDHELMRPWLYRIATNVCLDELARRPRRALTSELGPPLSDPTGELAEPLREPVWIEPMPTAWLDSVNEDPASSLTRKESVALAFVAALHVLTPSQRATLLLREVVGFSAEETAAALGISLSAANSALHRARTALGDAMGGDRPHLEDVDPALLARYVRAWESNDVEAIVALLRDDIVTTMPPRPTWVDGLPANAAFYRHMIHRHGWQTALRMVITSANGQPALAYFRAPTPEGPFTMRALQVLTMRSSKIARIDHFMTEAAFPAFGLSARIANRAR